MRNPVSSAASLPLSPPADAADAELVHSIQNQLNRILLEGSYHSDSQATKIVTDCFECSMVTADQGPAHDCRGISRMRRHWRVLARWRHIWKPRADEHHLVMPAQRDSHRPPQRFQTVAKFEQIREQNKEFVVACPSHGSKQHGFQDADLLRAGKQI